MVDFLIVACREWDFIKYYTQDDDQMRTDLRLVESVGALPLEVGAVLPQPREVVGGQTGHSDGIVHQPVLVRQDLSEIKFSFSESPLLLGTSV